MLNWTVSIILYVSNRYTKSLLLEKICYQKYVSNLASVRGKVTITDFTYLARHVCQKKKVGFWNIGITEAKLMVNSHGNCYLV